MSHWVIAVCAPCTSRLRIHGAGEAGRERARATPAPSNANSSQLYSTNTTRICIPSIHSRPPPLGPRLAQALTSDSPAPAAMLRSALSRTLGRPCSRPRCRLSTLRVVPSTADRQLALPLAFLSVHHRESATPPGCATLACSRCLPHLPEHCCAGSAAIAGRTGPTALPNEATRRFSSTSTPASLAEQRLLKLDSKYSNKASYQSSRPLRDTRAPTRGSVISPEPPDRPPVSLTCKHLSH